MRTTGLHRKNPNGAGPSAGAEAAPPSAEPAAEPASGPAGLLRRVLRLFASVFYKVRVRGARHRLGSTPAVVVVSYVVPREALFVALFLEGPIVYVVPADAPPASAFRLLAWLFPAVRADTAYRQSPREVREHLRAGCHVVFFQRRDPGISGLPEAACEGPARALARTDAPLVPILVHRPMLSFATRSLGSLPRRSRKPVAIDIYPPVSMALPHSASYPRRVAAATDGVRRAMLETLVDSRSRTSLFAAYLRAAGVFGWKQRVIRDARGADDSYRTMLGKIAALGRIAEKVSAPGATVGVMLPTAAVTVATVLGLTARGRIPAMINFTSGREGVRAAFETAGLQVVLTSRAFVGEAGLEDLVAAFPPGSVRYLEDFRAELGLADKLWILAFRLRPRAFCMPLAPAAPGLVLFTSGSEERPKAVLHSHDSILANVAQLRAVSHFSAQDRFLMALPFFHSFGFTLGLAMPVVSGASAYLYPSPLHYRRVAELVKEQAATVLFGTPTFLAKYAEQAAPGDFRSLTLVISGGERLPETITDLWRQKFGLEILDGYGATECGPVISVNTPECRRPGSVGRLLPGISAKLEPRPGFGGAGLLRISGPNVMLGYLDPEQPQAALPLLPPSGYRGHVTGDIVEIDRDGYLFVRGRARRFAKVAGEMVSLDTVEQLARLASPDGGHAAAIRPDPDRGEAIVLFTTDRELSRERLAAAAHSHGLPEIVIPRQFYTLDAIPLLGNGKTDYAAVDRLVPKTC